MDFIYYNNNINNIEDCIEGLFDKNKAFMILERIDKFLFIDYDDHQELNSWEKGRIFDINGEFKWRKFKNRIHGVYLGTGLPKNMQKDENMKLQPPVDRDVYLWGKIVSQKDMKYFRKYQGKNIYIELRIPFIFQYPLDEHHQRVLLKIKEYPDLWGRIQFMRYADISSKQIKEAS